MDSLLEGIDMKKLMESLGQKTVKELVTGTSNMTFPTLVFQRIAIQLATLIDARALARLETIAPGEGLVHTFQTVSVPASSYEEALVEGTGVTEVDATLGAAQATISSVAVNTYVSDLAARQSAWNVVNAIGVAHGNALNRSMNSKIYAQINAATGNAITVGTAADGVSANFTFDNVLDAIGMVEDDRGRPNAMVTYPRAAGVGTNGVSTGFYPFIKANITSVQFTSALADFVRTGRITELFGLRLFIDSVYKPSNVAADGADLCAVLQMDEAVGWAQAEDISSEVQRVGAKVGFTMTSHYTGVSKLIMDAYTSVISHAS